MRFPISPRLLIVCLVLLGVLFVYSSRKPPYHPGEAGTVFESPRPTPKLSVWETISETCSAPGCAAQQGFAVNQAGNYTFGAGASGSLSNADLNSLNELGVHAINQDLTGPRSCEAVASVPDGSNTTVTMTDASGVQSQVYDLDTAAGQRCWLGDHDLAVQLGTLMDGLAGQYASQGP